MWGQGGKSVDVGAFCSTSLRACFTHAEGLSKEGQGGDGNRVVHCASHCKQGMQRQDVRVWLLAAAIILCLVAEVPYRPCRFIMHA